MFRLIAGVLSSVLIALSAGCANGPLTADDLRPDISPNIELQVSDNKSGLEFTSKRDMKCSYESKSLGCLESPVNTRVSANFSIVSDEFRFSCFEVCLGNNKNGRNCELDPFQRLEFGALIAGASEIASPDQNGKINLRDAFGADVSRFAIANQNSLKEDYYYRVQACRNTNATLQFVCRDIPLEQQVNAGQGDGDPVCIWNEDPPWPNRGRHRQ